MFAENVTFLMAFWAGILSFFSPCILPLLPSYVVFMSGLSADELIKQEATSKIRNKALFSTIAYVLGFSSIFIGMGAVASFIGDVLAGYLGVLQKIGGFIIIIFGLHFIGFLKLNFLNFEKRFNTTLKPTSLLGFFFVGMAFAAGWTPCIGPILGSLLIIAGTEGKLMSGLYLLAFYSLGLAIPFILLSFFINFVFTFIKKANNVLKYIGVVSGLFLIFIGVLLITNKMSLLGL